MHQRQKWLEKGLEVGADDNQAGGKEKMTNGCKTICQIAAEYETFIIRRTELQTWHGNTIKSVALLAFQASWTSQGSLSGQTTGVVWMAPRNPYPSGLVWSRSQWFQGGSR